MGRRAASEALAELAFAAELLGDACPWPIDAKATAGLVWGVRQAEGATTADMARLPGMTPLLAAVVDDALHERPSPVMQQLKALLPPGLFELRRVKGLGPKKVQRLWRELGIESLGELEYACRENRLVTLDGFGDKTQQAALEAVSALASEAGLMRRDSAMAVAAETIEALRRLGGRVDVAGAWRRGCELVDEVVLVSTMAPPLPPPARVRVVVAPPGAFGRILIEATGSEAHVASLRARAEARGIAFDDHVGDDEDDVYAALGLLPTPPELREQGTVIEIGQAGPRLVRRTDLLGALHNHTTASDGADDLVTMARAAAAQGLAWLGISDHSAAAAYAGGLDAARLKDQRAELARAQGEGVRLLSGVESDIMKEGHLDLDDDALVACDVVVASMHQRYGLRGEAQTARLVRAALHPLVDVVGHPTGRLLLARAPADFDVAALIDACAISGTAVELNANPARLDFGEPWLRLAKERGVLVSIAADAHAADELRNLEHGIAVARRAGLGPDDILNTRSAAELLSWVQARRARALTTTTPTPAGATESP
jgi:DNA polymerase (family 10)